MEKAKIANLNYTIIEPSSYLVAAPAHEVRFNDYCARMGECNTISGLLPMHRQYVNGECQFYYDITGKKRLSDYANQATLSKKQGEHIFHSLLHNFEGLQEYFLRASMCVLDVDYLFVDDHMNTFLPLLPLETDPEQSGDSLKELFLSIIGTCFARDNSDPYFDRLLKLLVRPGFDLEKFAALAVSPKAAPQAPPVAPAFAPPVSSPAPQPPDDPTPQPISAPKKGKAEKASPNVAPAGFRIPGAKIVAPPTPKKAEKKKSKLIVFGHHFGEKKATAPEIDMEKEDHVISECGHLPKKPMPTPAPSAPQPGWSGTILEPGDDRTTFLDEAEISAPVLVHQGRRIAVTTTPFTLGRSGCQYVMNSAKVTHHHATLMVVDGRYCLQDENSTNHSYVDGVVLAPFTPYPLVNGAVLRLADQELTFEWTGGTA